MPDKKNIFVADDILIKTGCVILFLTFLAGLIVWHLRLDIALFQYPGSAWIFILIAVIMGIMPVAFLTAGYRIRAIEKQYLAVWNILEKTLEVSIHDLVNNTGIDKETIIRALHEINRRGSAFFIYDRPSGLIFDGRLKSQTIAINTCPACEQTLGYTIPLVVSTLPRCKYCGTDLDATHINRLKQEKIRSIRASNPSSVPAGDPVQRRGSFNWVVFVILLVVFWPLALGYAFMKSGRLIADTSRSAPLFREDVWDEIKKDDATGYPPR